MLSPYGLMFAFSMVCIGIHAEGSIGYLESSIDSIPIQAEQAVVSSSPGIAVDQGTHPKKKKKRTKRATAKSAVTPARLYGPAYKNRRITPEANAVKLAHLRQRKTLIGPRYKNRFAKINRPKRRWLHPRK